MSTTDGAIDPKLFYDLEWIYGIIIYYQKQLRKRNICNQQNFIAHFKHKSNSIIDSQV